MVEPGPYRKQALVGCMKMKALRPTDGVALYDNVVGRSSTNREVVKVHFVLLCDKLRPYRSIAVISSLVVSSYTRLS